MSTFLDQSRVLIDKIATGNAGDPGTKAAVEELKTKMAENEATDAEQSTVITELLNKLAASAPADPAAPSAGESAPEAST